MAFEDSAGLNVSNHYGPRVSGGTEGRTNTPGTEQEFYIDLDESGLAFGFPVPAAFTKQGSFWVTEADDSQVTGTITVLTVGGVNIAAASVAVPVEITSANTGVLVTTGATAGKLLIKYRNYPVM
jgi:hypothetical protein